MEYTYASYKRLMDKLRDHDYAPTRFCDVSDDIEKSAIIRHDVDMDLQEAVKMAELEQEIGIRSTYFVLITSEYYNLLSGNNMESARRILELGHEIGLHFDITAYEENLSIEEVGGALKQEISIMENVLNIKVKTISWHIPRKDLLGVHLAFTDEWGVLNAYDPHFYSEYKYVSDSMMRWREPVEEYIEKGEYKKLQILTHPIWYHDVQDMTAEEILDQNRAKKRDIQDRYLDMIKPGYYQKVKS